jgi:predicted deacylase
MAPPLPVSPDNRSPIAGDYQAAEVGGLFRPSVNLGERVTAGALLGHLVDALGVVVSEVRAGRSGTVAALAHIPLLQPGERIAYIG